MKKYLFVLLVSFCSVIVPAQEIPKISFDGRFGSKCLSLSGDPKREICVIPFQRVLVNPERYNNKVISLTGFLVKSFDRPVLFPDEASYRSDMQMEGIELMGKFLVEKDVDLHLDNGISPVTVIGVFDATYQGGNMFRLGAMKNISSVTLNKIIPER